MKKITLFIAFVFVSFYLQAQSRTKQTYVDFINEFFNYLYLKPKVTVKEAETLLGENGVMEFEEYLFEKQCANGKQDSVACNNEFERIYSKGNTPTSLLFGKIKQELLSEIKINDHLPQIVCSPILLTNDRVVFKVSLDRNKFIYITLNSYSDENIYITNIYLANGSSIYNKIDTDINYYLELPGIINDKDGYVNIRESPNAKAKIVGTIKVGERFYYIPYNSSWVKVKMSHSNLGGYIYYNRIKKQ